MNGHWIATPSAREAQHPAHFIDQLWSVKKGLRRPFGPIRIAGQKDGFGDLAGFGKSKTVNQGFTELWCLSPGPLSEKADAALSLTAVGEVGSHCSLTTSERSYAWNRFISWLESCFDSYFCLSIAT